jgi:hypothetical protein
MEPLVAGGAAETFERHVQQLFPADTGIWSSISAMCP